MTSMATSAQFHNEVQCLISEYAAASEKSREKKNKRKLNETRNRLLKIP